MVGDDAVVDLNRACALDRAARGKERALADFLVPSDMLGFLRGGETAMEAPRRRRRPSKGHGPARPPRGRAERFALLAAVQCAALARVHRAAEVGAIDGGERESLVAQARVRIQRQRRLAAVAAVVGRPARAGRAVTHGTGDERHGKT